MCQIKQHGIRQNDGSHRFGEHRLEYYSLMAFDLTFLNQSEYETHTANIAEARMMLIGLNNKLFANPA